MLIPYTSGEEKYGGVDTDRELTSTEHTLHMRLWTVPSVQKNPDLLPTLDPN